MDNLRAMFCVRMEFLVFPQKNAHSHIHTDSHWSHIVIAFTLNTLFFFFWLNVFSEPFFHLLFIEKRRRRKKSRQFFKVSERIWYFALIKWRPGITNRSKLDPYCLRLIHVQSRICMRQKVFSLKIEIQKLNLALEERMLVVGECCSRHLHQFNWSLYSQVIVVAAIALSLHK